MRTLGQKVTNQKIIAYTDAYDFYLDRQGSNPALDISKAQLTGMQSPYGMVRVDSVLNNTDKTLADVVGSGRLMAIILPNMEIANATGNDYTLTVQLDDTIYNLTNPTPAEYKTYNCDRPSHWFNMPVVGEYPLPNYPIAPESAAAASFGFEFKTRLKVDVNCPVVNTDTFTNRNHAAFLMYTVDAALTKSFHTKVEV